MSKMSERSVEFYTRLILWCVKKYMNNIFINIHIFIDWETF